MLSNKICFPFKSFSLKGWKKLEFNSGEDVDIDIKATFMAEARFLRAYAYFDWCGISDVYRLLPNP